MFGNNEEKRLLFHCQNRETIYKKAHYLKKNCRCQNSFFLFCRLSALSEQNVICHLHPRKASQHNSTVTSIFMGNAVIILMAPNYVPRLKRTLWGEGFI